MTGGVTPRPTQLSFSLRPAQAWFYAFLDLIRDGGPKPPTLLLRVGHETGSQVLDSSERGGSHQMI
jgi:hypothetical protein